MKSGLSLPLSLCLAALLAGCDEYRVESTRNEIYKIAFRTSQFQEALERCEADEKLLQDHETVWKRNFEAAVKWLEMDPAMIENRQAAGREGLSEDAEVACNIVIAASKISFDAAERWSARIEDEEYCTIAGCD